MKKTIANQIFIKKNPEHIFDPTLQPQTWKLYSSGIISVNYSGDKLTLHSTGPFSRKQGTNELTENFKVTELGYGQRVTMEVTINLFYAFDESTYEMKNNGTSATSKKPNLPGV